jgi:hypothetical protein
VPLLICRLLSADLRRSLKVHFAAAEVTSMSSERTEDHSALSVSPSKPPAATPNAVISVHCETVPKSPQSPGEPQKDEPRKDQDAKPRTQEVSQAKVRMQTHLPALADDADVGVEKDHIVTRDGKADLRFTGTLLAAAAPDCAKEGHWQEYRVYQTRAGKHVFSKVTRTTYVEEHDTCEAEVFDPAPSTMPSQLMRGAREIARARPLTWMDAAVSFFGYDPLAKALYRKLSVGFEELVT